MATRRTKIFWAMCIAFLAFLLTVVSITGVTYFHQEASSRFTPIFSATSPGSLYNVDQLKNSNFLMTLGLGFSNFDPEKGLKLEVGFDPRNNLSTKHGEPTSFVCVSYQTTDLEFKAKEDMSSELITVPFSGDINWYPFDVWTGSLTINAHTGADNTSCKDPLPLIPAVLGSTQGFVLSATVTPGFNDDDSIDYSQATVDFTARRTNVHRGFSVLIFMVMWGLTLMLTFICCWTWKGGKRVELGIIAMTAALLYALPRVRESQPGIPKMGIIQDMVGYCWNILLIACSLISNMLNFILRKERKKALQESRKSMREDGSHLLACIEAQEPDPMI